MRSATKARPAGDERYRVDAVTRAIDIIRLFSPATPRLSAATVAASTGLSLTMARRMLHTLHSQGLLRTVATASDFYELGLVWLRLADIRRRQVDIRQIALPVMRRIRDALNETVILSIRAGTKRVNIDYVESTQATRRITQFGFEADLHIGAAGRVLLAALTPEELSAYLASVPLVSYAAGRAVSAAKLKAALKTVHRNGYAVALHEITSDTAAIGVPLRDYRGEIIAALTISCPEDRFTPTLRQACIAQATAGAAEVSRFLGYTVKARP